MRGCGLVHRIGGRSHARCGLRNVQLTLYLPRCRAKLADGGAETPCNLRNSFRAEDQQHDYENE